MLEDYICGLYDFLKCVKPDECISIKVAAYPEDVNYFTCDGTKEKAREVARHMLKKYHHGLIVVGISTSPTVLRRSLLVVHCI